MEQTQDPSGDVASPQLKPVPRTWCDDVLDILETEILEMHASGKVIVEKNYSAKAFKNYMKRLKTMIEDAKALDNLNTMVGHLYVRNQVKADDALKAGVTVVPDGPAPIEP